MRKRMAKRRKNVFCNLPYDLILEILVKLPVKSLCRFKTVSRSIHSSITSPQFVTQNRPTTLSCHQMISDNGVEIYSIDQSGIMIHVKSFQLVVQGILDHSIFCNGFICYLDNIGRQRLNVFNPTTGILIMLFPLPKSSPFFEFGFHPDSNKYKILCWREYEFRDTERCCDFQILTLGKQFSWKKVENTYGIVSMPESDPATNVNGYLFWLDRYDERIISFDLGREEFGIVVLESHIEIDMYTHKFSYNIFEFEGGLCLVEQANERGRVEIVNMWMLKDMVNNVWVSMLKNVVLPLEGTNFGLQEYYPVYGQGGEVMVLGCDYDMKNVFIYSYSFLNGQLRRIKVVEPPRIHLVGMRNHVVNNINLKQLVSVPPQVRSVGTRPFCADWVRRIVSSC